MSELLYQVLLLPVHAVLAWVYLALRAGAPRAGWQVFDFAVIGFAVAAWLATPPVTVALAQAPPGAIWPLLVATAVGFLAFSAVLALGWSYRSLRTRRSG
ncbi:MAG: hypothetical protein R3200_01390 [Xanthomonadales bacterium]|nr:hypothetical protein [Xanthomonadales bacterium]